ncbi:hypothetical protein HN803_01130 [candidate division WWE3 bacterium]|jgi:hypothetical protein|nr:hypothetical protein [candidate division WWE3 bacterium]MBT7349376.1 hypothetical protein [candidate division WWE3 bacterium]
MKKAFLKEYKDKGFMEKELDDMISAFHIVQGVNLLHFYLVDKKDKDRFEKVLQNLKEATKS